MRLDTFITGSPHGPLAWLRVSTERDQIKEALNQEPRCLCHIDAPSHCQQLKLRKFKALPLLFEEGMLLLKLCQQMTSIN